MTGFDEFEYAKQAVKLKVEDYLMKPLDQKTIWETIQTAKALEYSTLREKKRFSAIGLKTSSITAKDF